VVGVAWRDPQSILPVLDQFIVQLARFDHSILVQTPDAVTTPFGQCLNLFVVGTHPLLHVCPPNITHMCITVNANQTTTTTTTTTKKR